MHWVSQNYLTSSRTIQQLLKKTSLQPGDRVIEIGPGKGHLTQAVMKLCGRITAVEIDPVLVGKLRKKFGGDPRLHLVQADFLSWHLPRQGDYKVISNLPFNQTTAILRKLTEAKNPPQEAWLLMERGAALRFLGIPRESLRSLMLKPRFDMCIQHRLKHEDFHPAPSVDVVMVYLKRKEKADIPPDRWRDYEHFVADCLSSGLERRLTRRQMKAALNHEGAQDKRSGIMLYVQWLCLFRYWIARCNKRGLHPPG